MKWADISEIPPVMIRAVILREDRRFKNNFFPMPHRGNDNMVIIPQITKKLIRSALEYAHDAATRYSIAWLESFCVYSKQQLMAYFSDEGRGGSTISNQVMEMLYTKSITTVSDRKSFNDRQIHQKEHELPASLTVDWFWTEDNLIEAYVNEIYGGHLYSDIRGFKSQAEMYFMKDLTSLNLREQIMLVAAIKKPSRIKEYAMWIKAGELNSLMNKKETRPHAITEWEKENTAYRVERGNFADILVNKEKAKSWIENRINSILKLLYVEGEISKDEYLDALDRQKISFKFAPGIYSLANRLVNNIKREIDRGLGFESSDSGLAVVTTIDMDMQGKLQDRIDRESRWIYVDSELRLAGQPDKIYLEGGARIIRANDRALSVEPKIVNKILADAGGTSSEEDEWDWITLANRSLGSSLKPILDLYFILMGYHLQDELKNSKVTYKTYSLEQQRIYKNYIHKFPRRQQEIENIEKYWSWSPKNFTEHTDSWIRVEDALARSINSVHVQIQEIVTPAVFAELLNEMMNITEKEGKHQPYRSLILGGSQGDQRYDKFLQAYSIFPNRGILKKQTYLEAVRLPDGRFMIPDYKPLRSVLLERYGKERVAAACLLLNFVLRDIVKRGTMHAMAGIGAGKTGTSNEFRDALATVHFISGTSTYIAGVRLGNRHNYSIGESADTLAVPILRSIVTGLFDRSLLMKGDEFDAFLKRLAAQDGEIMNAKSQYCLKGSSSRSRRLDVYEIQEEKRKEYLTLADKKFEQDKYAEAAVYYESFLNLATKFDSNNPAFRKMILCYIKTGNLKRAGQLIERFATPGKIPVIARAFESNYNVRIKVDEDFYSGDEKYERKKRKKKIGNR
jgi:membrane peptidoglycan carboxypeptidase